LVISSADDDNDPDNHVPPVTNNDEGSTTPPRTEAGDSQPIGLLTQLLEPKKSKRPATVNRTLEEFKQAFLEKTTTLDRARAHLDSLTSAQERDRVPAKLRVSIQPMVIDKDNRAFQIKWNETLRGCEKKLLDLLIEHLNNTISDTIATIRNKSDECLTTLKRT